jgi:hypothetical protein
LPGVLTLLSLSPTLRSMEENPRRYSHFLFGSSDTGPGLNWLNNATEISTPWSFRLIGPSQKDCDHKWERGQEWLVCSTCGLYDLSSVFGVDLETFLRWKFDEPT